jgi:hypothetical protein
MAMSNCRELDRQSHHSSRHCGITQHYSWFPNRSEHDSSLCRPEYQGCCCFTLTRLLDTECRLEETEKRIYFPNPDGAIGAWGHALITRLSFTPMNQVCILHPRRSKGHIPLRNFIAVQA